MREVCADGTEEYPVWSLVNRTHSDQDPIWVTDEWFDRFQIVQNEWNQMQQEIGLLVESTNLVSVPHLEYLKVRRAILKRVNRAHRLAAGGDWREVERLINEADAALKEYRDG